MKKNKIYAAYITVIIIGLMISLGVCISKNILNQPISNVIKILSDACLLPAVMFCGLGGLTFASNSGIFNMLVYGTKSFFCHVFKRTDFIEKYDDYFEYNKEKIKEKAPFAFILIPGMVFLGLAILFTVIYSNIEL